MKNERKILKYKITHTSLKDFNGEIRDIYKKLLILDKKYNLKLDWRKLKIASPDFLKTLLSYYEKTLI